MQETVAHVEQLREVHGQPGLTPCHVYRLGEVCHGIDRVSDTASSTSQLELTIIWHHHCTDVCMLKSIPQVTCIGYQCMVQHVTGDVIEKESQSRPTLTPCT